MVHSSTGMAPFECLHGHLPLSNPSNTELETLEANSTANASAQWIKAAHAVHKLSKEKMSLSCPVTDTPSFEVGKRVWLNTKNIQLKTEAAKLDNWRLGAFPIRACISD